MSRLKMTLADILLFKSLNIYTLSLVWSACTEPWATHASPLFIKKSDQHYNRRQQEVTFNLEMSMSPPGGCCDLNPNNKMHEGWHSLDSGWEWWRWPGDVLWCMSNSHVGMACQDKTVIWKRRADHHAQLQSNIKLLPYYLSSFPPHSWK